MASPVLIFNLDTGPKGPELEGWKVEGQEANRDPKFNFFYTDANGSSLFSFIHTPAIKNRG